MADIEQIRVGGNTYDIVDAVGRTLLSTKQDKSNLVTQWSETSSNSKYPSEKLVKSTFSEMVNYIPDVKQTTGSSTLAVMSQNAVTTQLNGKAASSHTHQTVKVGSTTFSTSSPVTLVAGSNITLTPSSSNNNITIASTGGGGGTIYRHYIRVSVLMEVGEDGEVEGVADYGYYLHNFSSTALTASQMQAEFNYMGPRTAFKYTYGVPSSRAQYENYTGQGVLAYSESNSSGQQWLDFRGHTTTGQLIDDHHDSYGEQTLISFYFRDIARVSVTGIC